MACLKLSSINKPKYITHSDHASTTDELQAPVVVLAHTIWLGLTLSRPLKTSYLRAMLYRPIINNQ